MKYIVSILTIFTLISFSACTVRPSASQKIVVLTTFYPLYEFTNSIAGDKAQIINLTPAGTEPHAFEPKPQDMATLEQSKLFIYNGSNFEPWINKILPQLKQKKIHTIDTSVNIKDKSNPHFWLDPNLAKLQVEQIADGLATVDPQNSNIYRENANRYKNRLDQLDQDFRQGLNNCGLDTFITTHEAFNLLADRYQLKVESIAGLSPEVEPSPQQLATILNIAKQKNIKYIFFESLVSPKLSDTIAKEVGAQTLILNPVEGLTEGEIQSGENYFTIQTKNLNNLRLALQCI